ncbi:hypothetical protein L7F22_031399 [Adiantum nelumboides]|nr:hypothetical protein [Adiantum nelumboides]
MQVGSHYHFIETNPYLEFDREKAFGMRLNILSGTAVRFEPGETKTVTLVKIGGRMTIKGGNNIARGPKNSANVAEIMDRLSKRTFAHVPQPDAIHGIVGRDEVVTVRVSRESYANIFGPTTGDKLRLGDTNLVAEIENDYTVYGDECKFGGGKVLRDGMGQASGHGPDDVLDTVITNAVILDYTSIYKADIGIKGHIICGIGKAGNPDVMDGVTAGMIVGVNTEAIAGGLILTAGGIDAQVHWICPQLAEEAIASGISLTTVVGGGTGPAHGTCATTCTPSPMHMEFMLKATDAFPLNIGLTGKGNTSHPHGLGEVIRAGAIGLKLHEDWETMPAAIKNCLDIADKYDIQVNIHTDTLNESGFVEHAIEAFGGRTIHTYHSEGAGGGHAPDIIKVCGIPSILPSSTNPTRPFTVNTIDEHLDMLIVCHHLDKNIPEDVSFAESRIRGETIAAEDILHDMGAISMMASDSQAMGRIGEVITRTWQTAHKMKMQRGQLSEAKDHDNDNFRIKRYIAKYTINPAITHGFSHLVGSVEVGKMADLVLWHPGFFGTKPSMVIKGGVIAWAQMGDANASIPSPEPVGMKPMFGAFGKAASSQSFAFVSKESIICETVTKYGLNKMIAAVKNVRGLSKLDMKLNTAVPDITVDPETYVVTADNVELKCSPARELPLARNYFLF